MIEALINRFGMLETVEDCPMCGEPMVKWKNKNPDGTERCGPVCMVCGHREMIKRNDEKIQLMGEQAKRQDAINRVKNNSIMTDKQVWDYNLENYKVIDQETKTAKGMALAWVDQIIKGDPIHAIYTGKPGAGKTHLSMGIISEVLRRSDYKMSCAVVSYPELLDQLKVGFNDPEIYKTINQSLMNDLKKVDLVVVDDLGAELGLAEKPEAAKAFDINSLTLLAEARLHRATIFTSNLNSDQLMTLYGERVYSRMLNGAASENGLNAFRFKVTADKRRVPV